MISDSLTIKITGKNSNIIPATSFLVVVYNMLRVLKDVDAAVAKDPDNTLKTSALEWSISKTEMNSPLTLDIVPLLTSQLDGYQEDNGRKVLMACEQGLRTIENNPRTIPPFFREKTLLSASKVVRVLSDGIRSIEIFTPYTKPLLLTQRLAAHVDELVSSTYTDLGTFEGRLTTLSVHTRSMFRIEDEIYGYITCYFKEGHLEELKNGMFSERVAVSGETRYSPSGQPISIQVEQIERLRSRNALPQFADLEGINFNGDLFDLAGGVIYAE